MWIGCVKLSLLRRKYFSPAVNVLNTSLRLWLSLRETLTNPNVFTGINKYGKAPALQIPTVFGTVYPVASGGALGNRIF